MIFAGAEHFLLIMNLVGATGALTAAETHAGLASLSAEWVKGILQPLRNIRIFFDENYKTMPLF